MICSQCDETRPSCEKCRLRGQQCVYKQRFDPAPVSPNALVTASSPNHTSQSRLSYWATALPPPIGSQHPGGIPSNDLAQHYLTHTTATLVATSTRDSHYDFWRTVVPALAYTSSPVQHGMLALAALCLHFHTASSSDHPSKYLEAAVTYGNLTLKECGEQLRGLRSSLTNSVLTSSRILCALGFAFFRIRRQNGATIMDPESWLWLWNLRGVYVVHNTILALYKNYDALIARDLRPDPPPTSGTDDGRSEKTMKCRHPLFCRIQNSYQYGFIKLRTGLRSRLSGLNKEQAADLFCAVDVLQEITEHICLENTCNYFREMCVWPCQIPQGFVHMLLEGNALALAVYAHWLVLVILVEDLWWVKDMGRAGIREIVAMSSKLPSESDNVGHPLLHWPQCILDDNDDSSELSFSP